MHKLKAQRTLADRISNAYHFNPITKARFYIKKDLKYKRLLRGTDTSEQIEKAREIANSSLECMYQFTGVKIKRPRIAFNPIINESRYREYRHGEYSYINKTIYLNLKNWEDVIPHEIAHHARMGLKRRKIVKEHDDTFIANSIMEEGVADFIRACVLKGISKNNRNIFETKGFRDNVLQEAQKIYKLLKSADSTELKAEALHAHFRHYFLSTGHAKFPLFPYLLGNALAVLLFTANGFDEEKTAREMMTNPNEVLLQRIIASVANDQNYIERKLTSQIERNLMIDKLNELLRTW